MFGFPSIRPGDYPEPGPPDIVKLGIAPGYTIKEYDDLSALDKAGRAIGVSAADQWNPHRLGGFVDVKGQTVNIPSLKALNGDQGLYDATLQHEGVHTHGLDHDETGHGWFYPAPDGSQIPIATAADLTAAQAKYAPPLTYDWSKAFPKTAAADPAASAVQLAKSMPTTQDEPDAPAEGGQQ